MPTAQFVICVLSLLFGSLRMAGAAPQTPDNRQDALTLLCQRIEIGPGAVVADVGCGEGVDTFFFADIVGAQGKVLAQEIDPNLLQRIVDAAERRGRHQIVPVLGHTEDPHLPDGSADLVFLNRVFHHLARPQAMLKHLKADLKPGGWLVIVDQKKGPLTDWAPTESREKQHHWTGETTVVRLAREAGFFFHNVLDDLWHEKEPFVLAFRKPMKPTPALGDPCLPRSLDADRLVRALRPAPEAGSAVVFFGLDAGRTVLPALQKRLPPSIRFYDVVIDEWALSRQELPVGAPLPDIELLRTEKNHLPLPNNVSVGLVVFVDAYHRLWDPLPLLRSLKRHMPSSGRLAIIDRKGPENEPRRLAGHQRRISSQLVVEDLQQAGFHLSRTLPAPAKDRFFLLFTPGTSKAP